MAVHPYVSFEGPIGAGKTTLAELLSRHTSGDLFREDVDGNPFLADFYNDKNRWALPMQEWFLVTRWHQLSCVPSDRSQSVISDYSAYKDRVFSHLLLESRELDLYNSLAKALSTIVVRPSLIVYIDASNEVLLERITKRGRSYESEIDSPYLESVRSAYEAFWQQHPEIPLLHRDTSKLDLKDEAEMTSFFSQIMAVASSQLGGSRV